MLTNVARLSPDDRLQLIKKISPVISKLQQDPTPLAELTTTLLDSSDKPPFLEIINQEPEIDLVAGLTAPSEAINLLTLQLLSQAQSSADVGYVAGKPEVVASLVETCLTATTTSIAEKARAVLINLLAVESPFDEDGMRSSADAFLNRETMRRASTGLMWRRLFTDKDIYGSIFAICSLKTLGQPGQADKRTKTISQGRLLSLLGEILYAPQLWESQLAGVEQQYGVSAGHGLLDFALFHMVDCTDDILIHITLIDFCTQVIAYDGPHNPRFSAMVVPATENTVESSLEVMLAAKLHDRTMTYYLRPDPEDPMRDFLYGPAAAYIAAYASTHAAHFQQHAAKAVLRRCSQALSSIRPSEWANDRAPLHDVKLLATIPRHVILANDATGGIVSLLPVKPANADALHALARIWKGPEEPNDRAELLLERVSAHQVAERAAARALFFLYMSRRPNFWREVTTTADLTANKGTARAAIALVHAIADANWGPLRSASSPSTSRPTSSPLPALPGSSSARPSPLSCLPTESQLRTRCSALPHLPFAGALALISEPAIGTMLPWLISGPPPRQSVSGEADPDVFALAQAKHAILPILRQRLEQAAATHGPAAGGTSRGAGDTDAAGSHVDPAREDLDSAGGGGRAAAGARTSGSTEEELPRAWRDVLDMLVRRERMGPLGNRGGGRAMVSAPNPEVGTMEM